jgi:hypothetical protein
MPVVHAAGYLPPYAASLGWLTPQNLLILCVGTLGMGGAIKVGPLAIQGPRRPRRRRTKRQRR